jgi:hypothetical protein
LGSLPLVRRGVSTLIRGAACSWICAAGLLLAGCGGSSHSATSSTGAPAPVTAPAPSAQGIGKSTSRTSSQGLASPGTTTPGATSPDGSAARLRFLTLASGVCGSLLSASPSPPHGPITPAILRGYATASIVPIAMTGVALARAAARASQLSTVRPVLLDYQRLQQLYGEARTLAVTTQSALPVARAIEALRARLERDAVAARVPRCAQRP